MCEDAVGCGEYVFCDLLRLRKDIELTHKHLVFFPVATLFQYDVLQHCLDVMQDGSDQSVVTNAMKWIVDMLNSPLRLEFKYSILEILNGGNSILSLKSSDSDFNDLVAISLCRSLNGKFHHFFRWLLHQIFPRMCLFWRQLW